jgi:hypothetical protein
LSPHPATGGESAKADYGNRHVGRAENTFDHGAG